MSISGAGVVVRPAVAADAPALCKLSIAAIRGSADGHYRREQLDVWAARRTVQRHREMVEHTAVYVASDDDVLAGFASVALQPALGLQVGEVDQLFVNPLYGERGVARQLLDAVESAATKAGVDALVTHASWRAAPVFERLGYARVEVEAVELDGEVLTRVLMRKPLASDARGTG